MDSVEYTISREQDHFIYSDDDKVAMIAGKGAGKSFAGARFALYQVTADQEKSQGLIMFNTLQQARDVYAQDFERLLKELRWPYHFNMQTMTLKIFDSIIHFRSAEADSIKNIESIEYHWGWADEASFYDFNSLVTFTSRIRKGKSKVRITSMPDDPDHPMYEFLDNAGYTLFELGLNANPDKTFAERYEKMLRAIYSGPQLQRFLNGERVSLAGQGMFAIDSSHLGSYNIDPNKDIYLSWDFNYKYRAVSAWQEQGFNEQAHKVIACVMSWQMKEATVYEDALQLGKILKNVKGNLYLAGDASGSNRSAQTTESMWQTVRRGFTDAGINWRSIVPKANPAVKDTIQCANWALRNHLVMFDKSEKNVYRSMAACKANKHGEIDKSNDESTGGAKSHETDTARYIIWHFFRRTYPGGSSQSWVV